MSTKQRIFIPTYISSVDYQPARVQPRILFYNGLKECEPYYIAKGSGLESEFEAFPYFDNYSGQITEPGSLSLLFFNEEAPYGVTPTGSLYTQYWEDYVELLYNPRTRVLNASAIIPLADYFKMELNDIVEFRGNYYHLRAINDYNLKNGECQIQLLGPILAAASPASQPICDYDGVTVICETPPSTTTSTSTTTTGPTTTTTTTICGTSCRLNTRVRMVNGSGFVQWTRCCGGTGRSNGIIPSGASYTIADCAINGSWYSTGGNVLQVVSAGGDCTPPPPSTTTTTAGPTTTTTTAAPTTTTTTTAAPNLCDCANYTINNTTFPGSGLAFSYLQCGTGTQINSAVTFQNPVTVCAVRGTFNSAFPFSGPGASCTAAACTTTIAPTTTTTTTLFPPGNIEMLLIAGGGGGGFGGSGGPGGGAGGYVDTSFALSAGDTLTITIGNGGGSRTAGQNSTVRGAVSVTAIGGGSNGGNGGSGAGNGGLGTFGQGNNGGTGVSGAGGGAGGNGGSNGGTGRTWFDGVCRAGGGGGGSTNSGTATCGGAAGRQFNGAGFNATANTGGGGGGVLSGVGSGGSGGSGICIIRYAGTPVATGGTITQSGGYTYHRFTTNGTFAMSTLTQYTDCGRGTTTSGACVDASNNRTFYSNCDSSSFGVGCLVYVDLSNLLTGFNYVFMNGATWDINSSTGQITGLSSVQC